MSYSIVILSQNIDNLRACIRALRAAGERARVIVVWDEPPKSDTSRPHMWEEITRFAPVDLMAGREPFCFARNANIGIRAAGDDDVVLLNDDAILEDGSTFASLRSYDYGIVAATTDVTGYPHQLRRIGSDARIVRPVRFAAFVAVYIPRSTIDQVGLLDERFGGPGVYGGEDVDYCLRVHQGGLKVGVSDECFVDHSKLQSTFRGAHSRNAAPGDIRESNRIGIEKWGVLWPHR